MIKVTVLVENTVGIPAGLTGEWGLSMLIEAGGKKILFDTGESGGLANNAAALKVDLQSVDALVISHGHYDHTGGMRAFLRRRGRLPVYAHPRLFSSHYSALPREHYIGIPFCREELESLGAHFIFLQEPGEIAPGLWVSGEVPRKTAFEEGDSRLFWIESGNKLPDSVIDDVSIYCSTPEGLVIIPGCAHAGLVNIIEHARQVTGIDKVYGIIGGTHLGMVPKTQKEATIDFLKQIDLPFLAVNHCTGLPTAAGLSHIFGSRFHFAPAGATFSLPLVKS